MIKIKKTDSIVDIIRKIKNSKDKEVILEFPFGHPILHNYTSLKILKTKSWKKDLIIITNDATTKKIWKKLWIKYSLTNNLDLIEHNYTFFEYFIYVFKNYFREVKDLFLRKTDDNIISKYQRKYWNWKIWFFISWLILSLFLLIFIFYFAVNKTYIYITPEIEVKTKSKNFVFELLDDWEIAKSENTIKLKEFNNTVKINETYATSWIKQDTVSKSKWTITLYNLLNENIDLIKNTRVQTDDWITFLIEKEVKIPKRSKSWTWVIIPWKTEVIAISKVHDIDWKIVWERGNIGSWTILSIPWLKINKDKIYAKSLTDFSWWNSDFDKILTTEDLENAKKLLESKAKKEALENLKRKINNENEKNNIKYKILWVDNILYYSNFQVHWIELLKVWEQINDFSLSATVSLKSYAYDEEKVIAKFNKCANEYILENIEKIFDIEPESLRIADTIWKEEWNNFKIKSTAQIEVLYLHNFLNNQNNYINKLKSTITGINKEQAHKILLNNPHISDVDIKIRPFFINHISKITDNIIFKIVED